MLDYKPRERGKERERETLAALGGGSSVFFLITFIILGSGNCFSFLAQFHKPPKRCRLHSAQPGADRRSLVRSPSLCLLSLSALGRSLALPFQCCLSLVAAETRLACSVSIEVRFRSQQARDPLDKYKDIDEVEEEA